MIAYELFAIRTLCYRLDGHSLSFSDRADRVAGRSLTLDPQAVFDYLYFHAIPAPRAIFSDVLRLASRTQPDRWPARGESRAPLDAAV